jgi:LmbE family N-acetylglucosaminyl deacetylase
MPTPRILILVPHPDDEVVACAAAMARARLEGTEIFALYLTHGCIAKDTVWPWQRRRYAAIVGRRRAEAEQAARALGIQPVGWSDRPARHLWRELPQAREEIRAAITACPPDQLWLPAFEGGNADHDGLNALGQLFKPDLKVMEFAEYNYCGGHSQAQTFPYPNGTETTLILTPEEKSRKQAALRLYASEKLNLNYVGTDQECYRPLADYDYSRPPHPGTLWYTRFQWVPFRHPGVDFTDPADVAAAIMALQKT